MDISKKILIADESPDQRRALRENLLKAGFTAIEEAGNGEEALMKIIVQYRHKINIFQRNNKFTEKICDGDPVFL